MLGRRRPLGHHGAFRVLIAAACDPDLVQREHGGRPGRLPVAAQARVRRLILLDPCVTTRRRRPPVSPTIAVALTSGIHLGTEGPLWLALDTSEVLDGEGKKGKTVYKPEREAAMQIGGMQIITDTCVRAL